MKNLALGLAIVALTACGSDGQPNEKKLHNVLATARATGIEPHWILWMQLKELPRKPERVDEILHIFNASTLHASGFPIPLEAFESESACQADSSSRTQHAGDHFWYLCRPVGFKF